MSGHGGQHGQGGRGAGGTPAEGLIPKHGGYRNLKSFQIAQLIYDVTVRFCDRYIDRFSRTKDQMVQAARSGVQNIAEGSKASGTSKKTELKLTNVARASLEELRLDYEDFLRQRGLRQWEREDPRRAALINRRCGNADEVAQWVKGVHERSGRYGQDGQNGPSTMSNVSIQSTYPEIAANAALVLIAVEHAACWTASLHHKLKPLRKTAVLPSASTGSASRHGGSNERLNRNHSRTNHC